MKIASKLAWIAVLLSSLAMAGCAGAGVRPEQPILTHSFILDSRSTLGQTFTAFYNGLSGVHVYLRPIETSSGQIVLHLRASPLDTSDLRTASIPMPQMTQPSYYAFEFLPITDSTRKDYYIQLEIQGSGSLQVGAASGEVYLFGALYQNGQPQDAQLTFGLGYDPGDQAIGLLRECLTWAFWLLAALALFVAPGWALLEALWLGWARLRFWERFGLASGVSLAIYPLSFLWTDLLGLHLGALYAWLPALIGLGVLLWKRRKAFPSPGEKLTQAPGRLKRAWTSDFWADISMLLVVSLIIGTRLWVIRRIDLPLWGDSYQHTMIAQLLVDHGGLFQSWEPYAELASLTYHFGFHTFVAVLHWVTRLPLPQATLATGQLLNVLAILALYPLAARVGRNAWAGVFALLLAGLSAPMPMYYLNWGRYTQLAGQVILPVVALLAWERLESGQRNWSLTVLCWITLGGLALTHVRVLFFALAFVVALMALNLTRLGIRQSALNTFWLGIGGALLSLPWQIRLYAGEYMRIFSHQITTPPSQMSGFLRDYNAIGDLTNYLPSAVWVMLMIVVGWALWRREREAVVVGLWWSLLLLAANPQWLGLPGAGVLSSFAVLIAAYIPAGVLVGAAAGWAIGDLESRVYQRVASIKSGNLVTWLGYATLFTAILVLGAWNGRKQLRLIDPLRFSLGTRADLRAFNWINENIPANAGFVVNSFFAYGESLIAGSDGGWWLPLLTQRRSTQPPLNYGTEQGPFPDYRAWINQAPRVIIEKGINHSETLELLRRRGIGYAYIGQQQGRVNSPKPLLDLQTLQSDPHFELVYHQDRVWIFKIR
jgi:hypothetical protein